MVRHGRGGIHVPHVRSFQDGLSARGMPAQGEMDSGQFRIAIATDIPLLRTGFTPYYETLLHDPEAIDLMGAIMNGIPILKGHNQDGDVYGRAYEPRIDIDQASGVRSLSMLFDMGKTGKSRDLLEDMIAGYARDVSVSWDSNQSRTRYYKTDEQIAMEEEARMMHDPTQWEYEGNEPEFSLEFLEWVPSEVSVVTIGADQHVGIGRALAAGRSTFVPLRNYDALVHRARMRGDNGI